MKKIIIGIFLLLSSASISSQIVIGSGKMGNDEDKTTREKLDNATIRCYYKFTQPVTADKQTFRQADTLTLDIGSKSSRYYDAARAKRDSLFGDMMGNRLNVNTIQSISVLKEADSSVLDNEPGTTFASNPKGETAQLYKNRRPGEIIIIERAENSPGRYKCTDMVTPKWDITSDTLTVLGYPCQKAVTNFRGRTYQAWFTPDIPVNDGPWKLYGLPGLILKAEDSENLFSFEIIGLEQLNPSVDISIAKDNYIKTNRKDLEKLKKKQSGGMAVNVNGGNVIIVQKKNNNEYVPLETE